MDERYVYHHTNLKKHNNNNTGRRGNTNQVLLEAHSLKWKTGKWGKLRRDAEKDDVILGDVTIHIF